MPNLIPLSPSDINTTVNHEPRILDVRLAEALGFANGLMIRKLITRHTDALSQFGEVVSTVERTSRRGGRPGKAFWLNERQALFLCTRSETPNATEITIHMVEVFYQVKRGADGPALGPDLLADYSARVHGDLAQYRDFVGKEIGGVRGAFLHYVKEYVVSPLTGLRQYLDDRFAANREHHKMILGSLGALDGRFKAIETAIGPVLLSARRGLNPEAIIREDWCDLHDVYLLAGIKEPIPRRGVLSMLVPRALDSFCKANYRQQDMGTWRQDGRHRNIWRNTAVKAWLKSDGQRLISTHIAKNRAPAQGVIPFPSPSGSK